MMAKQEYVEAHRDDINAGIRETMSRLDGTNASAVALVSGLSKERLAELGGVPDS